MRRLILRVLGFPVLWLDIETDEDTSDDDDDLDDTSTVSANAERADDLDLPFGFWSTRNDPGWYDRRA